VYMLCTFSAEISIMVKIIYSMEIESITRCIRIDYHPICNTSIFYTNSRIYAIDNHFVNPNKRALTKFLDLYRMLLHIFYKIIFRNSRNNESKKRSSKLHIVFSNIHGRRASLEIEFIRTNVHIEFYCLQLR